MVDFTDITRDDIIEAWHWLYMYDVVRHKEGMKLAEQERGLEWFPVYVQFDTPDEYKLHLDKSIAEYKAFMGKDFSDGKKQCANSMMQGIHDFLKTREKEDPEASYWKNHLEVTALEKQASEEEQPEGEIKNDN